MRGVLKQQLGVFTTFLLGLIKVHWGTWINTVKYLFSDVAYIGLQGVAIHFNHESLH